jgi:hypothetical protein
MVPGQRTSRQNPQGSHQKHILSRLALILLPVVAITSSSNLHAFTPPTPISRDLRSTLEYYLDADCGTEPKDPGARKKPFGALLTLLRLKNDPNLEARLLEILKLGLYPDDIKQMELVLGKEWEGTEVRINKAVQSGTDKPSHLLTKEGYVNQHLTWRIKENQQKAAVALVLLNTPKARAALALAAAQDAVLAKTIKHTYARFGIAPGFDITETRRSALTTRTQE